MIAEAANPLLNPWRYQAHPEVWLLVAFLIGAYIYVVRVLGPQVSHVEQPVTRKNIVAFVAAIILLWIGSDWPLHDLAEEYLYSMHMLQHMVLSYFVPPLALLATPEWLFRAIIGEGRAYRAVRWMSKPVIAGVLFNVVVMITHIPGLVNRSAANSPLHYSLHVILVSTAILMWIPICGPAREFHMGYAGKMIYLFLMSVVPTVPAAWLTFAEGTVYKHYNIPIRVWGVSVETDQQLAGAIMKTGGAIYLWTIVIYMFFRRFARNFNDQQSYVREDSTLTFDAVEKAFEQTPPAPEPKR